MRRRVLATCGWLLCSVVPAAAQSSLVYSVNADRANPLPLAGAHLAGVVYVFVPQATGITRVVFSLDGATALTEVQAPWDFTGGTAAAANPWNVDSLAPGVHTIGATVSRGTATETISATFEVGPLDVVNPTGVEFVASADHTVTVCPPPTGPCEPSAEVPVLTRYELRAYLVDASAPVSIWPLGKPTPDATGLIALSLVEEFVGLPVGRYEARVAAIGPYGESLSPLSNRWQRQVEGTRPPIAPGAPTFQPAP